MYDVVIFLDFVGIIRPSIDFVIFMYQFFIGIGCK